MVNPIEWTFTDYRDRPIPKPDAWDEHPEWFSDIGIALRIPGPRYVHWERDARKTWHWGPITQTFELGEYRIIEFRWDYSRHGWTQQAEHGRLGYAAWVGDTQVDITWETLDECLVDMVRFKYEGQRGSSGPRATEYFMRMIAAPEGKP